MRGVRVTVGTAKEQKAAAIAGRVAAMLAGINDTLAGKRDRALLALSFPGAFRQSGLVALNVEDLQEAPDRLRVLIRRSKIDQEREEVTIAIPSRLRKFGCEDRADLIL